MKENLSLHDLMSACISVKSVSIKSSELYEMIVNYFAYKQYTVEDLQTYKNPARIVKFFNSVATMYGNWNNQYFFKVMADFVNESHQEMENFQVRITLDFFKYFVHFKDESLKQKLANTLKQN